MMFIASITFAPFRSGTLALADRAWTAIGRRKGRPSAWRRFSDAKAAERHFFRGRDESQALAPDLAGPGRYLVHLTAAHRRIKGPSAPLSPARLAPRAHRPADAAIKDCFELSPVPATPVSNRSASGRVAARFRHKPRRTDPGNPAALAALFWTGKAASRQSGTPQRGEYRSHRGSGGSARTGRTRAQAGQEADRAAPAGDRRAATSASRRTEGCADDRPRQPNCRHRRCLPGSLRPLGRAGLMGRPTPVPPPRRAIWSGWERPPMASRSMQRPGIASRAMTNFADIYPPPSGPGWGLIALAARRRIIASRIASGSTSIRHGSANQSRGCFAAALAVQGAASAARWAATGRELGQDQDRLQRWEALRPGGAVPDRAKNGAGENGTAYPGAGAVQAGNLPNQGSASSQGRCRMPVHFRPKRTRIPIFVVNPHDSSTPQPHNFLL